jgi:hypothetical protein
MLACDPEMESFVYSTLVISMHMRLVPAQLFHPSIYPSHPRKFALDIRPSNFMPSERCIIVHITMQVANSVQEPRALNAPLFSEHRAAFGTPFGYITTVMSTAC